MPFTSSYEIDGVEIDIEQRPEETPDGSKLNANSGTVWDAGIVLMQYLTTEPAVKGKRGIELGCGTGIVGIAAAVLGMDVVLTDYEEVCVLAQKNADANAARVGGAVTVMPLEWTSVTDATLEAPALRDLQYILCSDLVCAGLYESTGLVALLRRLLAANPGATCLMSHELRSGDQMQQFVHTANANGLWVGQTDAVRVPPQYRCEEITVLQLGLREGRDDAPPAA